MSKGLFVALALGGVASTAAADARGCGIKLSRSAMENVQREIDWKDADARSRATQVLKEMLVDYTSA